MMWTPPEPNTIEASVTIRRPVEDVFRFYRDFRNLPRFLGDVMAIEEIGPESSRWETGTVSDTSYAVAGKFAARRHHDWK
jgi:uncharacterized membrane protein